MIKDLVRKNRSYRGYDDSRKITEDELKNLVDTARVAGSAANLQPLKYRLVCSEAEVAKINGITRWGKMLKDIELPHKGKFPTAYIVICVDTDIAKVPENANTDIGIAAQTILLAAVEQGLGGCMIGNYEKAQAAEALALPERFVPQLIVAIGKPDEKVVLTDAGEDGSVKYYRDANDVHYVPKRKLEDIII
ncbi:MAG: nitroreductase family protein [Lachnospiraceae bacterium]|nr:nitroreductase family protein [Lachnospiraceae bacterium]